MQARVPARSKIQCLDGPITNADAMSSDDDELAELRAARAARTGGAGATLSSLREQQKRAEEAEAARTVAPASHPPAAARDAPSASFGPPKPPQPVEAPTQTEAPAPAAFGPPRPPAAAAAAAFGPPRPPAAAAIGPPRPPTTAAAFGPPRPPHGDQQPQQQPEQQPQQQQQQREGQGKKKKQKKGEDEVEYVNEDVDMQDDMRQFFPLSFGEKEKAKNPKPLTDFHASSKRAPAPSFGPPRPPVRASADGATGTGDAAAAGPPRLPAGGADGAGPQGGDGEGDLQGPPRLEGLGEDGQGSGSEADERDDDRDFQPDPYQLPISHEVVLGSAHLKGVTCMDIEHSGSRLITGSMDYTIRVYDFNGMKRDMKAFREIEPQEGHPVLSVSWSPTGDAFMVVTGSQQAKIYDRDGHSQGEFVRGDMYIRDKKNTKGHTAGLCGGVWHPTDRYTAMTCGEDSTIRIWDTHNILQKTVVQPKVTKPTAVTTCAYGLDGKLIAGGLINGAIQLWSVSGKFGTSAAVGQVLPPKPQMVEKQGWTYVNRPNQIVMDAHAPDQEVTSLTFSQDGNTLVSRSMDSTLKVWDLRRFKEPLKVFEDLPCAYALTKVIFSPDEQLIVTGASAGGKEDAGTVVFIDKSKLEIVRKVGVSSNATAVAWHHRLNQIFVGMGNRKAGSTVALYDPTLSQRGVLIGAARAPRKPSPFDMTPEQMARAVYEAPLFKHQKMGGKKRREQEAMEAQKHHKPDPGMAAGAGKQGRIGTTSKTLLTQHLLKQRGALMAPDLELDPREAILRHEGKKDIFSHFTDAYKATQPVRILQEEEEEGEEED